MPPTPELSLVDVTSAVSVTVPPACESPRVCLWVGGCGGRNSESARGPLRMECYVLADALTEKQLRPNCPGGTHNDACWGNVQGHIPAGPGDGARGIFDRRRAWTIGVPSLFSVKGCADAGDANLSAEGEQRCSAVCRELPRPDGASGNNRGTYAPRRL